MNTDPIYCYECRRIVPHAEYMAKHVAPHSVKRASERTEGMILQSLGLTKDIVRKYVTGIRKPIPETMTVHDVVGAKRDPKPCSTCGSTTHPPGCCAQDGQGG